VYSIRNSKLCS